jgi:type 1 glutamine amidotransferase
MLEAGGDRRGAMIAAGEDRRSAMIAAGGDRRGAMIAAGDAHRGAMLAAGTDRPGAMLAAGKSSRTILVLTQTLGYRHASIPAAAAALARLQRADPRLRFVFLASAQSLSAARLRRAAVVVFLLTTGDLPLSAAGKRELLAFVHGGGGLVGFHSATDTFHHWPAYIRLIGGEFDHHPLPSTQRVIVEDRHNPATRRLSASFAIHEEFYVFKHDPRRTAHVLARLDSGRGGADAPLVWCRQAARGRVFNDALGHFPQTWSDPRQLDLARGGIEWAAGLAAAHC